MGSELLSEQIRLVWADDHPHQKDDRCYVFSTRPHQCGRARKMAWEILLQEAEMKSRFLTLKYVKNYRLAAILLVTGTLPGCIVAGGYSPGRGFFIWPGSFVLILVFVIFLLLRRGR
jgi:hypothetical protein